jgi:uncharacterized membrane protein SpoIIM required for sporulation
LKLDRFLADRSPDWAELEGLLARGGSAGGRLDANEIRRVGVLYRSTASDLAVSRRYFPGSVGEVRLQGLVTRSHAIVYSRIERTDRVSTFFSRTLWRTIYANVRWVGLAGAIMAIALVGGAIWALNDPSVAATVVPGAFHVSAHTRGGYYGVSVAGRGGLAFEIFINNIEVSCLTLLGGFTFGTLTAFMLAYNGLLVGVLGALEWRVGGFTSFLRLVVPHGLLELSCISLAGGAGFIIARALIDPGRDTRSEALVQSAPSVGVCTMGFMTFLVVAGLTEGFITPWFLPTAAAVAVGVALAGTFWTLVVVRGRPERPIAKSELRPEEVLQTLALSAIT